METTSKAARFSVEIEISLKRLFSRKDDQVKIKNISTSGAFIEMATDQLMTRDKIKLNFVVGDRERLIPAVIVWKTTEGIGVRFLPKNYQDKLMIDDLIYFVQTYQIGRA